MGSCSPPSIPEAQPLPWEGCRSISMRGWFLTLPSARLQGSGMPGSSCRNKPRNSGVLPGKNLPGSKFVVQTVAQPRAPPFLCSPSSPSAWAAAGFPHCPHFNVWGVSPLPGPVGVEHPQTGASPHGVQLC